MKNYLLLLSVLLGSIVSANAQETSKKWTPSVDLILTAVPTFKPVGTDTTTVNTFSIAPAFSFRSPAGFGFMYSPRLVLGGSNPGIFAHLVSIGIEQYDKPHYSFVLDYNHWFFTNNSSVPYSPLNNEIYSSYTYKKAVLRPAISAGFGFGNDAESGNTLVSDFGLSAGVSHLFGSDKSAISFNPGIFLNAGTNEYFSFMTATKYLSQSGGVNHIVKTKSGKGSVNSSGRGRGGSSGSSSGTGSTGTTTTTASTANFGISNVELNFEGAYEKWPFAIRPMGSLYFPVGVNSGSPVDGYWQINFSYSF
jgi:hypothetical protein